jgi:hypothetical protein
VLKEKGVAKVALRFHWMFNKCYLLFVYIIDGKIGHWLYQHQGIPMASNLPSVGHVSVGNRDTWSNLPFIPSMTHLIEQPQVTSQR